MILLITFVLIALVFSFLCSIAEAVVLSVTQPYIAALEQENKPAADRLQRLKEKINEPLAVILTLNTIAHTIGAAGAGAQAAAIFGNVYLGVFSAVLTLLILVFSEIIPKALGAHYWRSLAPVTAYLLTYLIRLLYPFVWLSEFLTRGFKNEENIRGFSRNEFAAMAELGETEGQLAENESLVLRNVLTLQEIRVREVMTPRTVMYTLDQSILIGDAVQALQEDRYSRIPIYGEAERYTGFVLRADLLMAHVEERFDAPLSDYRRELPAILDQTRLLAAFTQFIENDTHILLVVDEYGVTKGLITMEDVLETLLGIEITDESDLTTDLQALARRYGRLRRKKMGLDAEDSKEGSAKPLPETITAKTDNNSGSQRS